MNCVDLNDGRFSAIIPRYRPDNLPAHFGFEFVCGFIYVLYINAQRQCGEFEAVDGEEENTRGHFQNGQLSGASDDHTGGLFSRRNGRMVSGTPLVREVNDLLFQDVDAASVQILAQAMEKINISCDRVKAEVDWRMRNGAGFSGAFAKRSDGLLVAGPGGKGRRAH